ncbi:ATP-dependent 6-phosphofructokinase, chloroplastic [Sesamum alatum]|uniref:ATP-dependent 6-phosphofructokinase n=1 Tax=Sesamum alatum TaxID=300844 RepID=A0AAE1YK19_9LAMI|nr:ATP-dependent 6-phosphofructokinase, chloroplastic [Sesamum alatum]
MENGVREDGGVCSTETGNGGEDVYSCKESDASSADHLVVMVHGILGSASDWKFGAEQFIQRLPDKVFVHCSERNASKLTLDGVDVMGERLAEEVLEVIKRKPGLRKISFVAHSVGGLVARYAIGKLYRPPDGGSAEEGSTNVSTEESKGTIADLQPMNFVTVATPHLGSRGNKQVPFLFGVPAFERAAGLVIHWIFRRTGRHLFLTDDDEGKPPLLRRMVEDNEESLFMSALRSFKRRVAYSNVGYDHIVGWRTSSIRRNSELPKWEDSVDEKYPHVVYEERCKAYDKEQSEPTVEDDGLDELEEELVTGLSRLSWEKVDVSFHQSRVKFAAHSIIQVKDHYMHSEVLAAPSPSPKLRSSSVWSPMETTLISASHSLSVSWNSVSSSSSNRRFAPVSSLGFVNFALTKQLSLSRKLISRQNCLIKVRSSTDGAVNVNGEQIDDFILEDVPHLTNFLPDLPSYPSPLKKTQAYAIVKRTFVSPDDMVAQKIVVQKDSPRGLHFRRAGPHEKVYFKPEEVRACIVTCGGLCPGLNTVVREIVCGLSNMYGVNEVLGIQGGYRGFYSKNTIQLTPKSVNDIHKRGGTFLQTSRGGHDTNKIVDNIQDRGINQVYIIGGDGTQKGAAAIYKEVERRGLKVAVAGIPKTIDNDIAVIDKSFGFDTAVEEAQRAINAAHVEVESVENGVGIVKLMGRYSGFIAMHATLASRDVDCCLIPESPFYLEGQGGLFEFVEERLKENGHMVIVLAEGAGQEYVAQSWHAAAEKDASGNRLLLDVGLWLTQKIKDHFTNVQKIVNMKYIDPTYMIRAIPSNASDNIYCTLLAQNAVHGAMGGYTGFTVGPVNGRHAYIPINRVTETTNTVKLTDRMWARLLASTNQPSFLSCEVVQERVNAEIMDEINNMKITSI